MNYRIFCGVIFLIVPAISVFGQTDNYKHADNIGKERYKNHKNLNYKFNERSSSKANYKNNASLKDTAVNGAILYVTSPIDNGNYTLSQANYKGQFKPRNRAKENKINGRIEIIVKRSDDTLK